MYPLKTCRCEAAEWKNLIMNETMKKFLHSTKQMFLVTLVLMLVCGLIYPVFMTGAASVLFPHQAKGSLITVDGKAVASEHVGQQFLQEYYMWSRPSAYQYNVYTEDAQGNQFYRDGTEFAGLASGSNNYAPSNPALTERVTADVAAFLEKNPTVKQEDIPADLLTASGSGLDPEISPASAQVQIPRIAAASKLSEDEIRTMVKAATTKKLLGVFGEETVNVVKVNIAIGMAMGNIPSSSPQ